MSPFTKDYARIYDLLYREKDYKYEVNKIKKTIEKYKPNSKTILDYGCGTGNHAKILASDGYDVLGIEKNIHMLNIAKEKNKTKKNICFYSLDKRDEIRPDSVDVCITLFDVISYMNTNEEINNFFSYVKKILVNKGLFVLDFWYGPGVIHMNPEKRWKEFTSGEDKILRLTSPVLDSHNCIVKVKHEVLFFKKNTLKNKLIDIHSMRYFFKNEIISFLSYYGFKVLKFGTWKNMDIPPADCDWTALIMSRLSK